jgi:HlyD family secretion protein
MKERHRSPRAFAISLALVALAAGCDRPAPDQSWQGYVEVELTYVALQEAGQITELSVSRGDAVADGQPLFALDDVAERAALAEAEAELARARSDLADLGKGERPEELAIIQAQLDEATASLTLSEPRLVRRKKLVTNNIVGEEDLDAAQSSVLSDRGRIQQYTARLEAAKLPGRVDALAAARAEVARVEAALAGAQWDLSRRRAAAPASGRIEDTLFRQGEFAGAGDPVVALRTPDDVKIRFFVPEPALSALAVGSKVALACDGCEAGLTATVAFIAAEAEFTPPVIYSIGRRDKLVFMVEAAPDDRRRQWPAGLPVDVLPIEKTPQP